MKNWPDLRIDTKGEMGFSKVYCLYPPCLTFRCTSINQSLVETMLPSNSPCKNDKATDHHVSWTCAHGYVSAPMWVCVCIYGRERERDKQTDRDQVYVSVFVCWSVWVREWGCLYASLHISSHLCSVINVNMHAFCFPFHNLPPSSECCNSLTLWLGLHGHCRFHFWDCFLCWLHRILQCLHWSVCQGMQFPFQSDEATNSGSK